MTIRKKLFYGFNGLIALVIILALVNFIALMRTRKAKENTTHSIQVLSAINEVKLQIAANRSSLASYLLSGNPNDARALDQGVVDAHAKLQAVDKLAADQHDALGRVTSIEDDWLASFARTMMDKRKQVDAGSSTVEALQVDYLTSDPTLWVKKSNEALGEIEQATRDSLRAQSESDDRASNIMMSLSIIFALMAIAAGTVISLLTAKSITNPLGQLIAATREIAESGNVDQKIDIDRSDEIGTLGGSFANMVAYLKEMAAVPASISRGDLTHNVQPRSEHDVLGNSFAEMTVGLRRMVRQIRESASQVAGGSSQVASASEESAKINLQAAAAIDEVTSTMHEISINVQNMVKNTQVQSSSVSETSASIDEMVASIQRVADTAKVLLDISQRSQDEVRSGIGTMQKATDGLNKINGAIQHSSGIIGSLGTRADDIGKIIEVIDDLAEQTNLLALNAAIEAARAGEHGLGFAVVADEVRKLAEKSAQSTREISELIQNIQKEARHAVDNMEKSTTIVNDGLAFGRDLSAALEKIATVVTEVNSFAKEIGAATNEQSHGSTQISRATTRLNELTHEINSAVEEQASGAQSVARAMEKMRELTQRSTSGSTELAASAEQMSKMARVMLESMDKFVLEGSNGNGNGNGKVNAESLPTAFAPAAVGSYN
ncbi:MAG: methyl-accepting chemotaxis protein [Terriglobales bacterium]